jgi:SAM-dependent methyltransferase
MKIHLGCGRILLDGFINVDNSPTAILAKFPTPFVRMLKKLSIINGNQQAFSETLRRRRKDFLYSSCLAMPIKDATVDFAYSSRMLGWSLSNHQLDAFFKELHRVLRPGGGARLYFFDFDKFISAYQRHRSTIEFMADMPLGLREFDFRDKLKFLFSWNMQNGIPLNSETISAMLLKYQFQDIVFPPEGSTSMPAEWVDGLDLIGNDGYCTYIECRKGISSAAVLS